MNLKRTRKTWRPAEDLDTVHLMIDGSVQELVPLAVTTDEDGDEIVVLASHYVPLIGPLGPHNLKVSVPGLCGHYGCGKTLTISLN